MYINLRQLKKQCSSTGMDCHLRSLDLLTQGLVSWDLIMFCIASTVAVLQKDCQTQRAFNLLCF